MIRTVIWDESEAKYDKKAIMSNYFLSFIWLL